VEKWQWPGHAAGVNPHSRLRVTQNGDDKQKHVWSYVGDVTQGEAEQMYNKMHSPTVEQTLNTPVNQIAFIANVNVEEPTAWFVPGKNNTNGCGQRQTWNLPYGFKADQKTGVVDQQALQEFKGNLQKLHQSGITLTLTMGSWCTQFPIKAEEEWGEEKFKQFVTYFEDLREETFGGALDGIDFDWEGYCSETCLKGDCSCDWNHQECGTLSPEELAAGHYYVDTDLYGQQHKKMCWMLPTKSTFQVLTGIAYYMKKAGYVVTLVPMSTAMYSGEEDTSAKQNMHNEYVKYRKQTFEGKQVDLLDLADGILLQWYSGFDSSLCSLTGNPKDCQCDNQPDPDYPNVLNVSNGDGLISSYWTTHPGVGGNMFPQTFPIRCQACGKNVLLPDGTKGDLPCAPEDDMWFEPTEKRNEQGTSDKTEEHKQRLLNYTQTKKTIPYWWVKGLEVNSKCPRRIDCPDWRYEGEEDYASQVKLLQSLGQVVDLEKISTGFEALGIDVQVQMQAYVDPALPWTTATKEEIFDQGTYYHDCTQNMTVDNIDGEKRCAQPLLAQQWGPKLKAADILGLEQAVQKATGKGLGGIGLFTLDGVLWQPNNQKQRYWNKELTELNKAYKIPCHGDCCDGVGPGCGGGPAPGPAPAHGSFCVKASPKNGCAPCTDGNACGGGAYCQPKKDPQCGSGQEEKAATLMI